MITLQPVFILAVIFGAIVAIIYLNIRKKERMALLQMGKDTSAFESQRKINLSSLKYGLLLVAIGLGVLIANILVAYNVMDEDAAYFSMVFIFGGAALLVDYFIEYKKSKNKSSDKPSE